MDIRLKEHLQALEEFELARDKVQITRQLTEDLPLPTKTRPMVTEDIKVGQVVWFVEEAWQDYPEEISWGVIEEILHVNDPYKAFVVGGCRYGLEHEPLIDCEDEAR